MSNDNRTVEPHDLRAHHTGSRSEHDGGARDKQPPTTSDEPAPGNCYHYTVEWDTNESEWCETADTE